MTEVRAGPARRRCGKAATGSDASAPSPNTAGQASRWQPGQSGNPDGLPPIISGVRLLAAQRAARAIHRLGELMESTDDRIALAAAVAPPDRAGVTPLENEVQLGSRTALHDDPLSLVPELDEAEVRRLAATPTLAAAGASAASSKGGDSQARPDRPSEAVPPGNTGRPPSGAAPEPSPQ